MSASSVTEKQAAADRAATRQSHVAQLLAAGQFREAVAFLQDAARLAPRDPALQLSLAGALRADGNHRAALLAVEAALAADPRSLLGLLMKGSLLERLGMSRSAALAYGRALAQCLPGMKFDGPTQNALLHAQDVHRQHVAELGSFVKQQLGATQSRPAGGDVQRIELFLDATLGTRRLYRQQPTDYEYPGLPAIEFHPREDFPWLPLAEAHTHAIREELLSVLGDADGFEPYVSYPDGIPLDQWQGLNHSPRWSAFHFFFHGNRYEENCQRCPKTVALLESLPQPQIQGRMPAAMFSVLRANTRIPPHTGVANIRLVTHLPLIVPAGCGFRVGNETRQWREGEAWVFDDTIEHEAWNDSDEDRVVMIFDVWNPRLSAAERDMIAAMMVAIDAFNDVKPEGGL